MFLYVYCFVSFACARVHTGVYMRAYMRMRCVYVCAVIH